MGFRPGTLVTLDNALKMLMVKSPNDIAVTIAEGISGSVDGLRGRDERLCGQARLARIAFRQSERTARSRPHVSSARDMAIIARALLREIPEQHDLFGIGGAHFRRPDHQQPNGLLGRYPGVDGMKTGYTCRPATTSWPAPSATTSI